MPLDRDLTVRRQVVAGRYGKESGPRTARVAGGRLIGSECPERVLNARRAFA